MARGIKQTLNQVEARHLISTKCPMSEEQERIIELIDCNMSSEDIAERVGEPLDSVKAIIDSIIEEFGAYIAG